MSLGFTILLLNLLGVIIQIGLTVYFNTPILLITGMICAFLGFIFMPYLQDINYRKNESSITLGEERL